MSESTVILERLLARYPKRIDLSLGRVQRLLADLGHPERRVPPTIHVAGTNGKGSTVAFMRAILEAAGKGVHVDTSPHLVRYNERIRLAALGGGQLVTDRALIDAFQRCEAVNGDQPITWWEISTVAALLLFSEHPADVLLLEVGLGGRHDASNVIERPAAAVVTPVSMDHMEFLGDTVEKIAWQKAGIFKRGCPAVIAPQSVAATRVLEQTAREVRATPVVVGHQDFQVHEEHGRLVYQDTNGLLDLPLPRLPGRHQHVNAGTAIATLRTVFGDTIPHQAFAEGLQQVEWPARLQRLSGDLARLAPAGAEVWLDGGHNEDGGKVLAAAMADLEDKSARPLVMIVGMLATKDTRAFLRSFTGIADRLVAIGIPGQAVALDPAELAAAAADVGLKATTAGSLHAAIAGLHERVWGVAPRVLICGSLYLAGEALRLDGTLPR
jgi:dihydrofolate synthase/folylpolyglutamate synthase